MSNLDPVQEAVERLEWRDAKEEDTPRSRLAAITRRSALLGGAAGLVSTMIAACGGDGNEPAPSEAAQRLAGQRHLQGRQAAEVRVRQPRDDEPVLRAHALRRRGRLQAPGLQLPVDRLGDLERR